MQSDIEHLKRELLELQARAAAQAGSAVAEQATRARLERGLVNALLMGGPATQAQRPDGATARWPYLAALLGLAVGLVLGAGGQAWWAHLGPAPVAQLEPAAATTPAVAAPAVDATDWAFQARTDASQGRFAQSLPAFKRAESQRPDDAQLFADHAEALGYVHTGKPDAEHAALLAKALTLDPNNVKALVLAGTAALQSQEFGLAIEQLARAAQHVSAEQAELKKLIESRLAESRRGQQTSGSARLKPAPTPVK